MGFVANALQEFEGTGIVGELERLADAGAEYFFALFGEADDGEVV